MTRKPHEDSRMAKYLERRILELKPKKTQTEIAAQAGFVNPNMITMIKQGRSKAALEQSIGRTSSAAVIEVFGDPVTENELTWLNEIREASDHNDPRVTARGRAAIRSLFGE